MNDLHQLGVVELAAAIADKKTSATEAAQHLLARAKQHEALGAYLAFNEDATLAQARAADARIAAGERGPLLGVPLAHKDIFVTTDFPTTAGSKMLKGYQSPFNATVVQRLADAGTVTLGKLSCDEFAMGGSNENSAYGAVQNPWDTRRVPGGSSGGSAAAVAARLVPAATGTDTGGSIRQPASFTGITGIKPTYGRCSRYGMVAFASSLDQAGPMARSAADCATLLSAMAGPDIDRDSTSLDHPAEDYSAALLKPREGATAAQPLKGLRIGLPTEFFGAGLKFGHRAAQYNDLADMYQKTRSEGFGPEVQRRIMIGTYVLSHGYYDAYYLQAQKIRRLIAQDFQQAFTQCDVIAGPVAPTVAWKIGEKSDDPLANYLADIYTLSTSLAGLPGMSVPAGFGAGGMPVGLQLVGNYFHDGELLHTAHAFQLATDWHTRAPQGF